MWAKAVLVPPVNVVYPHANMHMPVESSGVKKLWKDFLHKNSLFSFIFFFLNDPAPPEIYPLPLPDALPISCLLDQRGGHQPPAWPGTGQCRRCLEAVEGHPGVAVGHSDQSRPGIGLEVDVPVPEPAIRVRYGPVDDRPKLDVVERGEDKDAGARKARRIDFEGGILGGGADDRYDPLPVVWELRALLAFVGAGGLVGEK